MKSSVFFGGLLATLLVAGAASAAKTNYQATLDPDTEVTTPVLNGSTPTGTGNFTYDDVAKTLCGKIEYTGTTGAVTGMHIHQAPPGEPDSDGVAPAQGKLIVPAPLTSGVTFNFKLTTEFETSLNAGELYANIHTMANAKGEARGTLQVNDQGTEVTCPAPTNPDGGVSSSSSSSGDGGSTSSTSSSSTSSSGATSSTSSSGGNDASTTKSPPDAGDPDAAPAEESGCNVAGTPINTLSFAFIVGLGIVAVSSRLRRKKR